MCLCQRKKTLLKEYEERNRPGGILDRRFGENDPAMSLEERMLERFTRERQRAAKGSAFNLEDEDELTHYGQSLSHLDDFDDVGLRVDEGDEEDENGTLLNIDNFRSFFKLPQAKSTTKSFERRILGVLARRRKTKRRKMRYDVYSRGSCWILTALQPARKKTKAEVMTEVIAKSKEHKVRMSLQTGWR